ncbi:MAG TPA: DUF2934 domain-containing protein [Candidatus Polarisedimenticolia bacterium]|nr:DUF2934 domain-containing protein [Candidatus Polarisedimenticolia bacterium]
MLEKEKPRKTGGARKKAPAPKTKTAAAPLPPTEKAAALPPSRVVAALGGARATQGSPAVAAGPRTPITAEARWRMIAEAAYFKAQRRGFTGGDAQRDWAEAEAEIDAWLLDRR